LDTDIIHNEFPDLIGEKSNFYEYRKTALRWIQLLSGKEWTDYNTHDPGITILEALCYTLTEIDYKLDFSIEEILVSSAYHSPFKLQDNAFYLAENILTCAPVTKNDYRKLIIDNVDQINNAWIISPDDANKKDKQDLVLLLKKKHVKLPENAIETTQKILKQFKTYGSKILPVKVADFAYISLHVDIYIDNEEHAETVLAEMFFNLNESILNVNPYRQTITELEEKGKSFDAIFEGPKMNNGIITEEHLSDDFNSISLVRIKKIISATNGIDMINNLSIVNEAIKDNKIPFPIKKEGNYCVPFFTPKRKYVKNQIKVFKNQKQVDINDFEVFEIIERMSIKTKRDYVLKNKNNAQTYKLEARDRNIHDYYSIKNDFPNAYGLNEKGFSLIQNHNAQNSDQLKAFLLPFEQLLANSFMRLAHLRNLFSIKHSQQGFFNQTNLVEEFQSEKFEYKQPKRISDCKTIKSEEHQRNQVSTLITRDRFLTHLLARFDVHLNDGFEMHIGDDESSHLEQIIVSKEKLLQSIDKITYNRSVFDYQDTDGMSSLEHELYLRLAINKPPKKPLYKALSKLNYTIGEVHENSIQAFEIKEFDGENYDLFKVERIQNYSYKKKNFGFHANHEKVFEEFLKVGILKSSYKLIKSANNKKNYVILSSDNGTRETLISIKKTREAALNQVSKLVKKFRKISNACEGFYLVDHSLLEIKGENTVSEKKFLKFRMSFIFPDWTARFQNSSFQKQVQRIVTKLVPAHVRADCIWLNLTEMTAFENAYSNWHQAISNIPETDELNTLSNDLIELLKTYNPQKV